MNRLWQQLAIATNWPVLVAVAVLSALGVGCIWVDSPDFGFKQLIFLGVAVGLMIAIQTINYQALGRYAWGFYGVSLLLILYTVIGTKIHVPGVERINGACAWINFKVMSLEPSELMKISFVMALARYLRFRSSYRTIRGLIPPFLMAIVPAALILKQPDLGVACQFGPTLLAMLFVAGAKIKHILLVIAMGLAFFPVFWLSGTDLPLFRHMPQLVRGYQRDRVNAMFSNDPRTLQETGFQQHHALTAIGSGGGTGKGFGNIPVGRRIPEAHNDMVFALIGEQFGFIGSIVVLVAYIVLFAAGIEIASANKEPFGKLVALGVVSMLAAQTFLNLAVVTRLFPVTGVTLPFISYGGSSLLASFMAAGLLLNIGQNRPLVVARSSFEYD
jgi:rod shape determining protein RodA